MGYGYNRATTLSTKTVIRPLRAIATPLHAHTRCAGIITCAHLHVLVVGSLAGQVVLADISGEDERLDGEQAQALDGQSLVLGQGGSAGPLASLQHLDVYTHATHTHAQLTNTTYKTVR